MAGTPGPGCVGKAAVVRAVARRARAHLLEVGVEPLTSHYDLTVPLSLSQLNCYNYCSDSVAVVEKRFALDASRGEAAVRHGSV